MYLEHHRATKYFHSDNLIVVTYIPRQKEGEMEKWPGFLSIDYAFQ